MSSRWLRACVALSAMLAHAALARAQEDACHATGLSPDDELRLTPHDGAVGVALDAPIVLAYGPEVDVDALLASLDPSDVCSGQIACLLVPDERGAEPSAPPRTLPSTIQRLEQHTFVLRPSRPLPASSELLLVHARPGFDRATRGQASFETGDDIDREPPELDVDDAALDLRIEPPPAECRAPAGSLRVRLTLPTPDDDGDPTSVEVLAYLSRSAVDQPPSLRARARPEDADQDTLTLTLFLTPEEARGAICVALRAVDGAGRASVRSPESCFDPGSAERSQFASSCATRRPPGQPAPAERRDDLPSALLGLAAAAVGYRRGAIRSSRKGARTSPGARA